MVMHGITKVHLKLTIPLRIVVDKLGLRIGYVVYPMDQLVAIGDNTGALEAVVHSFPNRMFVYLLLAIHGKFLAPKKLGVVIDTNEEKQLCFLRRDP